MGVLEIGWETEQVLICKTLWFKSAQINRQLNNGLSFIHGIGLSEYMVLDSLVTAPRQTLSRIDLANKIGRTASAVTKTLAPMEKIGLVEKETGARDARVSLVKLTAAGERIHGEASDSLAQNVQSLLEAFSEDESAMLLQLLQKLPA
jgi:DNA-binding MarR family transcriptional regulator